MKRKTNAWIPVTFILLLLFQLFFQPVASIASNSDKKDTWTHESVVNKSSDVCEREYEVSAKFNSEVERTPIDLVFIQDASGSFKETIDDVRRAINGVIDELHLEDRVQLTTYRGAIGNSLPNGNWRNENWGGVHVNTNQPLTSNFPQAKNAVNRFPIGGGTPTALGIKNGFENYEGNKGDISNRKTVFVLITDGVANTRLNGFIKQRSNDYYYRTPRGYSSVEYNQDYKAAIAEVEEQADYIKNKGYELIVGFWEYYDTFTNNGNMEDRYNGPLVNPWRDGRDYPARPNVIDSLIRTASSPDNFVMGSTHEGENVDDFTNKLKKTIAKQTQISDYKATFKVDDRYTINESSVKLQPNPGNVTPEIEGNKIIFNLGELPAGDYEIKYKIKQKEPVLDNHVASKGTISVDGVESVKEVVHTANNEICFYQPNIEKDVEGKEHIEIETGKEYSYNVKTIIPIDISTTSMYEYLTLADKLDDRLQVVSAKVLVDGNSSDFGPVIDGQNVSIKLSQKELQDLEGKEVNLQITAKIRENTPIEVIDNKATIQLNDNPEIDSNVVTVEPPTPEEPDIEKDVDGEKPKDPVEKIKGQKYNYNIQTKVPEDLKGYKTLTLTDELDKRLEILGAKVLVEGKVSDFEATIDGQLVELDLSRNQLDQIAGKNLTLEITTKIKADVEIEIINNTAQIQLNNNPKKDSNTVPVIPVEPTKPEIDKDVEGREHIDIDYDKEYNYNVITKLPNNISDYKEFIITDNVDKGLEVLKDKVAVTVDGNKTDALNLVVDGNMVKVEVANFQALSGKKQIELRIPAKIRPDTDISKYNNDKIPNTAKLDFINGSDVKGDKETKPVTVTPPRGALEIVKIDKKTKEKLSGVEFELHNKEGQLIEKGITDEDGQLKFDSLPVGHYKLVETKAPEGYRLLKKPIDVEITSNNLEIELEVKNSKTGWNLPTTGGIGTFLFYGLGALLMVGALLLLFKRKTNKQIEE